MERNLIRKKWQITVPRWLRRRLGLFEGQTLNWELSEAGGATVILVFAGSYSQPGEEATFREELLGRKKSERKKARTKFGISDTMMSPRGRGKLREIIQEVLIEYLEGKDRSKGGSGNLPGAGFPKLNRGEAVISDHAVNGAAGKAQDLGNLIGAEEGLGR